MTIKITAAQHATVFAALRFWQERGMGEPDNRSDELHEIATDSDRVISLDDEGIDELCEKLNTPAPKRRRARRAKARK